MGDSKCRDVSVGRPIIDTWDKIIKEKCDQFLHSNASCLPRDKFKRLRRQVRWRNTSKNLPMWFYTSKIYSMRINYITSFRLCKAGLKTDIRGRMLKIFLVQLLLQIRYLISGRLVLWLMFVLLQKRRKRATRMVNGKKIIVRTIRMSKGRHHWRIVKTDQRIKMVIRRSVRLVVVLIWLSLVKTGKS